MRASGALGIVVAGVLVVGCDGAKADYEQCLAKQAAGDLAGAAWECKIAVSKDANSKSGKLAAAKLAEIQPLIDAQQKANQANAAATASAAAAASAARLDSLRAKVHRSFNDPNPDDDCQGEEKPPYLWVYSGGTYAEDAEVAHADGCRSWLGHSKSNNTYCCPMKPHVW